VLAAMSERGAKVELQGAHLVLDLGSALSTAELLTACDRAEVSVVELVPVARALT
jgi:hypothetical protein